MKTASFPHRSSEWLIVGLFLLMIGLCAGVCLVPNPWTIGQDALGVVRGVQRYLRLIVEEPGIDPINLDVEVLVDQVQNNENGKERSKAIAQLSKGMSNEWAGSAVPALIQVIQSGEVEQDRVEAAHALKTLGYRAREAIPTMLNCLGDANGQVRQAAVVFLVMFGGEMQAPLQQELQSPDPRRFAAAAIAMSYYPTISLSLHSGRLKSMTRDQDSTIRLQVAHALGHVEIAGIDQHLKILLHDSDPEVRAEAVESVGLTSRQLKETLEVLKPMLQDEEPVVRQTVVNTLCRCGNDHSIVNVIKEKVEQESDEETRTIMEQAMKRLECRNSTGSDN